MATSARTAKDTTPKAFRINGDDLSQVAAFLNELTTICTNNGVFVKGPFVIELPGAGDRLGSVEMGGEDDIEYVLTGLTTG